MSHNHQYSASHPDCGHRSHCHKPCSYLWCPLLRTQCPFTLVLVFGWWEVITRVHSSLQVILCVFVCGYSKMPQCPSSSQAHGPMLASIYFYGSYLPMLWNPGTHLSICNVILHVRFATSPHAVLVPATRHSKFHLVSDDAQCFQACLRNACPFTNLPQADSDVSAQSLKFLYKFSGHRMNEHTWALDHEKHGLYSFPCIKR